MNKRCKITLRPLDGSERTTGYSPQGLRELFGTVQVNPRLTYTSAEFFRHGAQATRGMSISGVQAKLSLALEQGELVPVARGGRYILKPSPQGYAHAAENEHAAMLASRACGIKTARCGLVVFSDGELAYLTRRFDRDEAGRALVQEELASVAGLGAEAKYETSYEALGKTILEASAGKRALVLDFFTRVMLAYVMGNDDLHAKNISLTRTLDNTTRYFDALAPNYDVLFVSSFEEGGSEHFLALDLLDDGETPEFGVYGYPTGHSFAELGKRLSLPPQAIQRAYASLYKAMPKVETIVRNSFMPVMMQNKALTVLRERLGGVGKGLVQ
ncbi:HipA domain-containing protein [Marinimicrobium sp. ABcell2]|uniref:HipA domain-containing protein n=1 Tax=Marinimicrobium sp. ABcell2 TaxID=3069751 RepID=UPI0027B0AE29|nr:HipA domain-containing protein [Marinimicrobium sp. ABcell2]MDQ2077432.1 HipA domain-containing protein [Marinimicrobium sp. ABcell2]